MNAAPAELPPRSWGALVLRGVGTLLAVVVLYVLSSGPAMYLERRRRVAARGPGLLAQLDPQSLRVRHTPPDSMISIIYRPLFRAAANTPLGEPLLRYRLWWLVLATQHANEKSLPGTAVSGGR
jgi:hypothetical protein